MFELARDLLSHVRTGGQSHLALVAVGACRNTGGNTSIGDNPEGGCPSPVSNHSTVFTNSRLIRSRISAPNLHLAAFPWEKCEQAGRWCCYFCLRMRRESRGDSDHRQAGYRLVAPVTPANGAGMAAPESRTTETDTTVTANLTLSLVTWRESGRTSMFQTIMLYVTHNYSYAGS
jgi:hypothetical protein